MLGVAEIADLEQGARGAVEQRVLELDVPRRDAHPVEVVDADDELLEEPPRLGLLEAAFTDDVLEHVAWVVSFFCLKKRKGGKVSLKKEGKRRNLKKKTKMKKLFFSFFLPPETNSIAIARYLGVRKTSLNCTT